MAGVRKNRKLTSRKMQGQLPGKLDHIFKARPQVAKASFQKSPLDETTSLYSKNIAHYLKLKKNVSQLKKFAYQFNQERKACLLMQCEINKLLEL